MFSSTDLFVFVSSDYRIHDVLDFLVNEESLSPTLPNHKKREGYNPKNKKRNIIFGYQKANRGTKKETLTQTKKH